MAEFLDIAKIFLEKPISGAFKQVRYVIDIKSVIKSLEKKKSTIEAWLADANTVLPTSQAQCLAMQQLIYALDELRDLLDGIATRKLIISTSCGNNPIKKALTLLFSPSLNPVVSAFRDARRVRALIEELDSIARPHSQLGSMLRPMFGTAISPTKKRCLETGPLSSEMVIGRDVDRDNVIRLLLDSSSGRENFSVVSIVGIGGMGKTTLAQYVFSDERVQNYFDVRLWVHVPQELIAKDVVRKMVELATNENINETAQLAQLQYQLHPIISGKKYLLVIDNIWDRNLDLNWPALMQQLGFGGPGSMVLATTRSPGVAKTISSVDPYMLRDLEDDKSWILFQSHAFRQGQEQGLFEAIGKQIVQRCPKVPLVIRSVACHLRGKQTVREWEEFKDKLDNHGGFPDVLETLKLTYDDLDLWVKRCFACCSLFPKGYTFREHELIYVWIALKLVDTPSENQSLVDVAKDYILRLKEEGLLVESEERALVTNEILLHMHDVIHDLSVSVGEPEYKMVDFGSCEFNEGIRHVSFRSSQGEEISRNFPCSSLFKMKKQLQSLLLVSSNWHRPPKLKLTLKGLSKFDRLKVLGLPNAGLEEVPSTIGELKLLRYLDLSSNSLIKKLPSSITKLVNLVFLNLFECGKLEELPRDVNKLQQLIYLDLRFCENLRKLPRGITELVKLRELHLYGCWYLSYLPLGMANMTDLQKLEVFVAKGKSSISTNINDPNESDFDDVEVAGLAELNSLNNLEGELLIIVDGSWPASEARAANLREKKLTKLSIELRNRDNDDEMMLEGFQPHTNLRKLVISYYDGERLPSWIDDQGYYNLEKIRLFDWKGRICVGSFGRLPRLKILKIEECSNLEYIESSSTTTSGSNSDIILNVDPNHSAPSALAAPLFPSLEELTLMKLPKLKGWRRMCRSTTLSSHFNNEYFSLGAGAGAGATAFPKLKKLTLKRVGLEVIPEEFRGLSSLEYLTIKECQQLKELPEWIDTLTSLKTLYIFHCPELTSLPKQMAKLSNLEHLEIEQCPRLKGIPTGEDWLSIPRFPKLEELSLEWLGIEFVPDVFQGASSLIHLAIYSCEQLKELPEWIDTLTSLKHLTIVDCPKLTSLPKQIANLANLQTLTIFDCSELKERCEKTTGQDWHLIQHVPQVKIDIVA